MIAFGKNASLMMDEILAVLKRLGFHLGLGFPGIPNFPGMVTLMVTCMVIMCTK